MTPRPINFLNKLNFLCLYVATLAFIFFQGCSENLTHQNTDNSKRLDEIEQVMFQQSENLDSLLGTLDTTSISRNEKARISTIKGLILFNNGNFDKCIKELEEAETVFIGQNDQLHIHINKLIRAFTFEYLRLYSNAANLYVECDNYFSDQKLTRFRFYSSLGLLRLSEYLKLDKRTRIKHLQSILEKINDPIFSGLYNASLADVEKNDSASILYFNNAIEDFKKAKYWSRVYAIELNVLFLKLKLDHSQNMQDQYNSFPKKEYSYTPTTSQIQIYNYGQAYLLTRQGKNTEAINIANKVLKNAIKAGTTKVESDCVHLLVALYKKNQEFGKAFAMLERYNKLESNSLTKLQRNQLLALGAHYRYSELERDKLELKLQIQKFIFIIIVSGLILILTFIIGWFILKTSKQKQIMLRYKNMEIREQLDKLLSTLKSEKDRNESLIDQMEDIKVQYNNSKEISELLQAINDNQIKSWMEFETNFQKLHPGWIETLRNEVPQLTTTDLRYCMCLYYNLNNYDISNLCHVGIDAVKSAKKRIRDRLGLKDATEIYVFLKKLNTK